LYIKTKATPFINITAFELAVGQKKIFNRKMCYCASYILNF